jgi:hypothetical protein
LFNKCQKIVLTTLFNIDKHRAERMSTIDSPGHSVATRPKPKKKKKYPFTGVRLPKALLGRIKKVAHRSNPKRKISATLRHAAELGLPAMERELGLKNGKK